MLIKLFKYWSNFHNFCTVEFASLLRFFGKSNILMGFFIHLLIIFLNKDEFNGARIINLLALTKSKFLKINCTIFTFLSYFKTFPRSTTNKFLPD